MATERFSLVDNVPSNCIVLHVKLTDSSLKCLENYRNEYFKKKSLEGMKIKLESSQGVINVPGAEGNRSFGFNLSLLPHNDASTECFLQSDKKKCFQNIGIINQKIIIRASEDVYQNTMEKISNTNLEIKKNCTKEIKLKGHSKRALSNSVQSKLYKVMEARSSSSNNSSSNNSSNNNSNKPPPEEKKRFHASSGVSTERRPMPQQVRKAVKAPIKDEPIKVEKVQSVKAPMPDVHMSQEPAAPVVQQQQPWKQGDSQQQQSSTSSSTTATTTNTTERNIASQEEYQAARREFDQKYKVLSSLNTRIENRLKYFNSLVQQFKQSMQKELLEPIYNEHAFLTNNDDHRREKEEFNKLHAELTCLKRQIQEYKAVFS